MAFEPTYVETQEKNLINVVNVTRFTSTSSLKKHMRTPGIFGSSAGRSALHKCDECGSRFTSTSNFKKHLRSHGDYQMTYHIFRRIPTLQVNLI